MKSLQFFSHPAHISKVDRNLLTRLLEDYKHCLPPRAVPLLVGSGIGYEEFCAGWADLFKAPDGFGPPLLDALISIETLSLPENHSLLEAALDRLSFEIPRQKPPLHLAVHLWLLSQNTPGVSWPLLGASEPTADSPNPHSEQPPTCNLQPSTTPPPPSIEQPSSIPHSALATPHADNAPRAEATAARSQSSNSHLQLPASSPASGGACVLDLMVRTLLRFLVLPKWAAEALSLFNLHTYGWELRDVTTYLGIESPQHRCGKSTLLALIRRLVQRPEVAAHISSPAVFRTIQRRKPTFIVDECEKVLRRNQMLTGILNASYVRDLAYVVRVVPRSKSKNGKPAAPEYTPLDALEPDAPDGPDGAHDLGDDVARYSCWCPKAMAQVGHFPETLADRCIIITMQRKTPAEKTERLRALKRPEAAAIHRLCEEFVQQHRDAIANAQPAIPEGLNDRAADIWEPLFVLADLAGGDWPQKARQAALTLSGVEQTTNVMGGLLIDCLLILTNLEIDRIFSRDLVQALNLLNGRPWRALTKGKPIDEYWLGRQLRPFGIHSQSIWVGKNSAKGYLKEDILEPARRYVSKADWEAYQDAYLVTDPPPELPGPPAQQPPDSKT